MSTTTPEGPVPVAYYLRDDGSYRAIYSEALLACIERRFPSRVIFDPFGEITVR